MTKDALFQLVSKPWYHYTLSRNLVWLRGTGKLYDNSKNVWNSKKKKKPFIFLNQLQAMLNSNEVLNYLRDYRFAIFTFFFVIY